MCRRLVFTVFSLASSLALASPPPPLPSSPEAKAAHLRLQKLLVEPLTELGDKQARMSRAKRLPLVYRLRVEEAASSDTAGARFFSFVLESRPRRADDSEWNTSTTGCFYPESDTAYFRRDDGAAKSQPSFTTLHVAALLRKKVVPPTPSNACQSSAPTPRPPAVSLNAAP